MFLEDGTVFALDGQGDTETIGFLPVGPSDPQWIVHVFPHNVLSLFTQQGVYVRHMSGNVSSATSLRLLLCNTDYMPSFIAAYPNVDVYIADIKEVGETELAQAFLNGTLEYDIIEIEASRLFRSLANKGYLANLLMSEKLAQNSSQFYPTIQSALTINNMLVGIPSKMTVETWAYDDKRWNTFIPENPPPCTFDQYMALCEEWLDAALQGEVDYCLVYPSFSFFQELYVDMLDLYINQYDDNSKSFTFDTPIFRNMINRIKELQMKYSFNTSSLLSCDSQQPLLNVRYNGHLKADEFSGLGEWKPILPIVFGEDEQPAINANLIVYVVNANSSNIETALCFLEHVVQNRAFADERLLKPDVNDPIERPKFLEEREALRNNIEYLHKLKETADKSELAQIEETLVFQEHLWNTGEERRWLISAEEIEEYRQIAKYLSIRQTALSAIQSSADYRILSTIIFKFADGMIDSNECIQQLNARLELMLFESD